MGEEATARRKDAHLDLCATGDVEPAQNSTLLECVRLVHCAMPEMAVDEVDLVHGVPRQEAALPAADHRHDGRHGAGRGW